MRTKPKNRWAIALALPIIACSFALVSWTFVKGSGHLPTPLVSIENQEVVSDPEKSPEFTGGQEAMIKYLQSNIKYPEKARTEKIEGTVYVGFVVTSTGAVTNAQLKKAVHELLDTEALRVIEAMPAWVPGEKDGVAVNCAMVIPIAFKL